MTLLRNRGKSSKELKRYLQDETDKNVSPRLVRKTAGGLGHLYISCTKTYAAERQQVEKIGMG